MSSNLQNSIWPNTDGTLGQIKVQIPDGVTTPWPEGDALVGNFVYKDGKLAGFVDTKALTVNDSKSTTINYDYFDIELPFAEDAMTINRGPRSKYIFIKFNDKEVEEGETFDFVIIDFNTTDQETINTVRTAKRVVDNKLYDANDNLIGTWDTSKLEVSGIIFDEEKGIVDGLFCNLDVNGDERGLILSEFNSDLSSLRNGSVMFRSCPELTSFNGDLSSLTDGYCMFTNCSNLTSLSSDLSSLTTGKSMFYGCTNLTSFSSDLSSLTHGDLMFYNCSNLTSFSSDLSSLTIGKSMFTNCRNLTSFSSDLSSLTTGKSMFSGCKLDTESVECIADSIKDVIGLELSSSIAKKIDIKIGNSEPNEQEKTAFNTIVSKGWTVYVNGSRYSPTSPAAITTLDENGEETTTPIPFWAKPVPATEETASYVDNDGNFYNILGAQFIYGDNLETYGMFTCEEDAAANMRLTKIEK